MNVETITITRGAFDRLCRVSDDDASGLDPEEWAEILEVKPAPAPSALSAGRILQLAATLERAHAYFAARGAQTEVCPICGKTGAECTAQAPLIAVPLGDSTITTDAEGTRYESDQGAEHDAEVNAEQGWTPTNPETLTAWRKRVGQLPAEEGPQPPEYGPDDDDQPTAADFDAAAAYVRQQASAIATDDLRAELERRLGHRLAPADQPAQLHCLAWVPTGDSTARRIAGNFHVRLLPGEQHTQEIQGPAGPLTLEVTRRA